MKYLIGHPSWCTNSNSYWHSDAILRQWSWTTLFQIITWRMTASDLMPIYCQLWPWEQILVKHECRYQYFSLKANAHLMLSLEVRPFCSGPGDVKAGKHSWQAIKIHDIFWPGCPLRSAAAHFRMLSKVVCHESSTAQLGKPNKPLKVKVWSWNCHSKNWWQTPMLWNIHSALQWRHNDHDRVSIHQPHGCLQPFIQTQIKENIKAPRHWPLCGEFTGVGEFPAQWAIYAENVSIWWRHHGTGMSFCRCSVSNIGRDYHIAYQIWLR